MAVYTCGPCGVTIMENAAPGAKIVCPSCAKEMAVKGPAAPASGDIGFPQKPAAETVLDLEIPDVIRQLEEKRRRKEKRS